jgi:flagellar hook assembly protein FlgD
MKNSIKISIVALTLFASATFTANAEDKEAKKAAALKTVVYISKDGKVNVLVDKPNTDANTTLLIKDESGAIVYREVIQKENQKFGRILNVNELTAGKYEIKVISKDDSQTKSFQLSEPATERVVTIK